MEFAASSLDDILRSVFKSLLTLKTRVKSTRGSSVERRGVLIRLKNPRARLSRTESKGKIFSALGELFWYLSGSDKLDHIVYYLKRYELEAESDGTIWGAYGPRLKTLYGEYNQIQNVCNLLKNSRSSKRAVIQLFDASDIANSHLREARKQEIPCTCTLQFLIRGNRLSMFTSMRSNDAYFGLQHDIFAFTMLQELIARCVNVELGSYYHFVGSLHLYDETSNEAKRFLEEDWQSTIEMPPMPLGDQWGAVEKIITAEEKIRCGKSVSIERMNINDYWADIVRLFQVFRLRKNESRNRQAIEQIKAQMHSRVFHAYLQPRKRAVDEIPERTQLPLNLSAP